MATTKLLLLALASTALGTKGHKGHRNHAIDPQDFIKVDGLKLKDSKGLHYLTGLNYWACMVLPLSHSPSSNALSSSQLQNLATPDSLGGNITRLRTELDQMAAHGVNHLRIMAASEGAPTPQPFRMNPALLDAPGKYNEEVFKGLDICLDEMSKRGMRATMTLGDQWHWSGGFAQYVSWAQNNTEIPYPESWNLTAPPQRTIPNTGWGSYTKQGVDARSYSDFIDYSNLIYSNKQAEQWYKDHIKAVTSRRNTVNGRLYTEDATIMTWQLANEPQAQAALKYSGPYPYNFYLTPNPQDLLFPWVERISTYIRSLAPKQLISVGFESKQGEYYFKQVHNFTTVDYATTHCWVQNWGIYDMYDSTNTSLKAAEDFAVDFLTNTSRWAKEIGKPVFLEEFGMARDNWENANKEYPYLSSAKTTHKDTYFEVYSRFVLLSLSFSSHYLICIADGD